MERSVVIGDEFEFDREDKASLWGPLLECD